MTEVFLSISAPISIIPALTLLENKKGHKLVIENNNVIFLNNSFPNKAASTDWMELIIKTLRPKITIDKIETNTYIFSFEKYKLYKYFPRIKFISFTTFKTNIPKNFNNFSRIILADNSIFFKKIIKLSKKISIIEHGVSAYKLIQENIVGNTKYLINILQILNIKSKPNIDVIYLMCPHEKIQCLNILNSKFKQIIVSEQLKEIKKITNDYLDEIPIIKKIKRIKNNEKPFFINVPDFMTEKDLKIYINKIIRKIRLNHDKNIIIIKPHPRMQTLNIDIVDKKHIILNDNSLLGIPSEFIISYFNAILVSHASSLYFYSRYLFKLDVIFEPITDPNYFSILNLEYAKIIDLETGELSD